MNRVEEFKYIGTTFQEAIKSRLKLGNVCYHLVQNLLSSSLLAKNIQIKISKPQFCLLFCMGGNLVTHINPYPANVENRVSS
jgi:hypothetical protein